MTSAPAPTNVGILVVCTANICRSPVVEGLLREKLARAGLHWRIESAGTLGIDGWPVAAESAAIMATRGLEIGEHRSQAITEAKLAAASLVLCMEQAHVETISRRFPTMGEKIVRLADVAGEPRDVADPYGGPLAHFETMVREVDDLLEKGLEEIIDRVGRDIGDPV